MCTLTDATSGTGAEWYVGIVMTASRFLWQEVIRVENVGVGERFFIPVDFECADDNGGTSW